MLQVNIVGIGPGNPELLTKQAAAAIEASNVLIGDKRMLEAYETENKKVYDTINTATIVEIVKKLDPAKDIVGVLVSGDVGFFSLTKIIADKLEGCEVRRFCGISSLVYFSQVIGISWDDAKIISMHGRNNNLISAVFENAKVFSLTGGANSPEALCRELCTHGLEDVLVYVGENLSYPDEKIIKGTAAEISKMSFSSLSVMMIINSKSCSVEHNVHGLADELFIRSKVPMTKQEVRAISLSKLQPKTTSNIYDIGAGTGSVSIELALQAKNGKVWAFERNSEAVDLIEKNKKRFGVTNLEIVAGEASENLKALPAPDCVFIGGSGGNLQTMLDTIYCKNDNARIVVNAITIETLAEVVEYYKAKEAYAMEVVNVFAARSKKLGSYNLMMAQNPVYVITVTKKV